MIRPLGLLLAFLVVFAACGDGGGSDVEVTGELSEKPTVEIPDGDPPAELVTKDIQEGDGEVAESGDMVSVQYVGISWSTGEQFDASWDLGQPLEFPLGQGRVIPGWDEGVEGMRVGGRRLLIIPPDLGYGAQGAPPDIAPNETLVFVVDLTAVDDSDGGTATPAPEPAGGQNDVADPTPAEATPGTSPGPGTPLP